MLELKCADMERTSEHTGNPVWKSEAAEFRAIIESARKAANIEDGKAERTCRWCKKPVTDKVWVEETLHNCKTNDRFKIFYYHTQCYGERTGDSKKYAFDFDDKYRGSWRKCPDCGHDEFKVMVVSGWSGGRTWLTCARCGKRFYVPPSMDCPAYDTGCSHQWKWDE